MATQNGSQGGAVGRQRKGVFWIEYDVSDLRDRLSGINADKLMALPEFKRMSLHYGLVAKQTAVQVTRRAVAVDPREAWRGVSLGYADRRGAPVLYLGINERREVDKRDWSPSRKGTRGQRAVSQRTRAMNMYWGRSRGFVLRWLNQGTKERITNNRGRMNRAGTSYTYKRIDDRRVDARRGRIRARNYFYEPARRALLWISEDWLKATSALVAKRFNR